MALSLPSPDQQSPEASRLPIVLGTLHTYVLTHSHFVEGRHAKDAAYTLYTSTLLFRAAKDCGQLQVGLGLFRPVELHFGTALDCGANKHYIAVDI